MAKKLPIWDQRMIMLMEHCIESDIEPSQKAFLHGLDMHEQAIAQIRGGRGSFTQDQILAAAKKYGVDINWIFGLSPNMKRSPGKSPLQNLKDAVKSIEAEIRS
jgi:hypothetical protein